MSSANASVSDTAESESSCATQPNDEKFDWVFWAVVASRMTAYVALASTPSTPLVRTSVRMTTAWLPIMHPV